MVIVARPPYAIALGREERLLVRLARDLGAADCGGSLSPAEEDLLTVVLREPSHDEGGGELSQEDSRAAIRAGEDPLGEELLRLRSAATRRAVGAFYTPSSIVGPMVAWALGRDPARLVDAGCGSGRFAAAVVRQRPDLPVVAVDLDPMATLLTRATLAVLGARQATVLQADFTTLSLPPIEGRTAWIGNPPYVRHHELTPAAKRWANQAGVLLGTNVSALAGLHAYFFLATALQAQPGAFGAYIVSAEWLDVGYGSAIRELLLDGLGGLSLHLFDASTAAFGPEVMSTAVIVAFEAGAHPETMRLARVSAPEELTGLAGGMPVSRATLAEATRWTPLFGPRMVALAGHTPGSASVSATVTVTGRAARFGSAVRLGQIARVHRGLVTGSNAFFVLTRARARELGIEEWCRPVITAATEILDAEGVVCDGPQGRVLLCPPRDVDRQAHPALDRYLRRGERRQPGQTTAVKNGYIASRRRPWWYLGPVVAPPVIASYMARRAPAFALNPDGLVLLNIAHGLWPAGEMAGAELAAFAARLNELAASFRGGGRTYHGGLEKFEPREMEALEIPDGERWLRAPAGAGE